MLFRSFLIRGQRIANSALFSAGFHSRLPSFALPNFPRKPCYMYTLSIGSDESFPLLPSALQDGQVIPLVELSAKQVAFHIPFEVVEKVYPPVPEQLQLRIAYWSFPENEEDIR